MKKLLKYIILAQVSMAILPAESAQKSTTSRKFLTKDFFIDTLHSGENSILLSRKFSQERVRPTDCRANIKKVMCLVDPPNEGQDPLKRACLPGGENYAHFFETLYDYYPAAFQRMFCSLNVIFVEKTSDGTAYAGLIENEQHEVLGAQMGIRKSVLDEKLTLQKWASWKEQLSFGGVSDSYTLTPGLPTIETSTPHSDVNLFLYFVVTHEFGHIFDFANNLNATNNCRKIKFSKEEECDMAAGSWGSIGWDTNMKPKLENEFTNRSNLCFYWCQGRSIAANETPRLYDALYRSDFVSAYATRQPWDDFADSLAYYLMNQKLQANYTIQLPGNLSFDIMAKLKAPVWALKYRYIEEFLGRPNINYP